MDVAVTSSRIKCEFAEILSNKLMEEDYMVKVCKTSILETKSVEERLKEKYLQTYLLDNIRFLNFKNEYGKDIINCDLEKIYNL